MEINTSIEMKYCRVVKTAFGITTHYPDGTESSIWPQDTDFYREVVDLCGHTSALDYCFEHDFCHNLVAEVFFDSTSYTIWSQAHGEVDGHASAYEERLVYYFQRYLRDLVPCCDPQWDECRARFHAYMESAKRLSVDEILIA